MILEGLSMYQCRRIAIAAIALTAVAHAGRLHAQVPSYASLYDPMQVLNLNFEMDPADWASIKNDSAYTIVKPAYFWADDESKIVVSVKRKPNFANGDKVALKIDINEYFGNLRWHGVKKLSLENGYDVNVVSEGFAWYLHRRAAGEGPDGYMPPLASWVNVTVNEQLLGMYASVEQVDKTFVRNRDLWVSDETWLYKQGDIGPSELKAGSGDSPAVEALNYKPFVARGADPPIGYETQVHEMIDVEQMLTVAAINAFMSNPDELSNKGKNFFFADFEAGAAGGQRLYFPWDLDAVLQGTTASIYVAKTGKMSDYQKYIINASPFHDQYNQIMLDLLDGPLAVQPNIDFLSELQEVLTPSLLEDPESNAGSTPEEIADSFDSMQQWMIDRHANVLQQVNDDILKRAARPVPEPSTAALLLAALVVLAGCRVRAARRMRG